MSYRSFWKLEGSLFYQRRWRDLHVFAIPSTRVSLCTVGHPRIWGGGLPTPSPLAALLIRCHILASNSFEVKPWGASGADQVMLHLPDCSNRHCDLRGLRAIRSHLHPLVKHSPGSIIRIFWESRISGGGWRPPTGPPVLSNGSFSPPLPLHRGPLPPLCPSLPRRRKTVPAKFT